MFEITVPILFFDDIDTVPGIYQYLNNEDDHINLINYEYYSGIFIGTAWVVLHVKR